MGWCGSCVPGGEGEGKRKLLCAALGLSLVTSLLLVVKEWAFAREVHELTPILAELVPSSCVPNPQNDGLYVHLECPVRNASTFYPPSEFSANIASFHGVFFEIKAEMFQITRASIPLPFLSSPKAEWVDHLLPNSAWHPFESQRNPAFFPQLASSLRAGGFMLPGSFAGLFREKQQLEVQDDGVFQPSLSQPPRRVTSETSVVFSNYLYTGNPLRPRVGDVRVSFWGSKSTHVSLIGKQIQGDHFAGGRTILDAPADTADGAPITILAEGDYGPRSLVEHRLSLLGFPSRLVWTWRALAAASLFFLFFVASAPDSTEGEDTAATPLWLRVLLAGLLASSCLLFECAFAWWAVEPPAARGLAAYSILIAIAALALRLFAPRCFPSNGEASESSPNSKYYDLGVSLHMPSSVGGSTSTPRHQQQQQEQRQEIGLEPTKHQAQVIRWTTSPALTPSTEEFLKKHRASYPAAASTSFVSAAALPLRTAASAGEVSPPEPPSYDTLVRAGSLSELGPLVRRHDSKGTA
ncbi:hypothetical protein Esti_006432 [Eimeria stiedai]